MKAFWALIVVLMVGAAALLLMNEREARPAAEDPISAPTDAAVETPVATEAPKSSEASAAPATEDPFPRPAVHEPRMGAGMAVATPAPETPVPEAARAAEPVPSEAAQGALAAGSGTTLDARFLFPGAGTAEDPYRITWATLTAAQETYNPRLGKTDIPEGVRKLDGAHVQISGFLAFPFMASQAQELLVMQNMWDGCCIGVPPTPYDAIEVTLAAPAEGPVRFMQYGAVTGVLKVDPFVRGDWLISLYTMSDAAVTPEM